MCHNQVMIEVNIFEIKAKFAEYLDRVSKGETVLIYKHNRPVAELRGVPKRQSTPRPIGPLPGRPAFSVPPSFFEPLSQEDLQLWEGSAAGMSEPPASKRDGRRRAKGSKTQ
jgi:prevent-host-death family protein